MKKYNSNYGVAVNWLGNSYVLTNKIAEVDPSVIENARFSWTTWTDEDGNEYTDPDDAPEGAELDENNTEIFQWYITDASEDAVKWLEEHFGLLFSYSDLLDSFVLCVEHYGTNWYYVNCECDFEQGARELGEKK